MIATISFDEIYRMVTLGVVNPKPPIQVSESHFCTTMLVNPPLSTPTKLRVKQPPSPNAFSSGEREPILRYKRRH